MATRQASVTVSIDAAAAGREIDNLNKKATKLEADMQKEGDKTSDSYKKKATQLAAIQQRTEYLGKVQNGTAQASQSLIEKEIKLMKAKAVELEIGSEAWIEQNKAIAEAEARLSGVKTQAKAAGDGFRSIIGSFGPVGKSIVGVADGFENLKTKSVTVIQSLGAVRLSMLAIPIFALIAAIAALVAYFKQTDDGARKLDGAFKAFGFVVDRLTGYLVKLGEFLAEDLPNIFAATTAKVSSFSQAVKDAAVPLEGLFNIAKSAGGFLIAPFKTLAEITIIPVIKQLAADIEDAANAGFELANKLDQIEEKQRSVNQANAESEKVITQLILQSRNHILTEEERVAKLKEASQLETDALNRTLDLQNDKIVAAEMEIMQAVKKQQLEGITQEALHNNLLTEKQKQDLEKIGDELLNKRSDLIVENSRLQQDSFNLQEKIANREATLIQAINAERQKANADRLKAEQNIQALEISLMEQGYERELAALSAKNAQDLAAVVGTEKQKAVQRKLINEKYLQDVDALNQVWNKKYADDKLAIERQIAMLRIAIIKDDEQRQAASLAQKYQQDIIALQGSEEQKAELRLLLEQKLLDDIDKLELDSIKKRQDADEKASKEKADMQRQVAGQLVQMTQNSINSAFQIAAQNRTTTLNAELGSLAKKRNAELANTNLTEAQKAAINAKYDEKERQLKQKNWDDQQEAAKQQAVINGALAVTNILANMVDPTPFQIFKIIAIGAAVATTAAQIAVIESTPPPQFAEGGFTFAEGGKVDAPKLGIIGEQGSEWVSPNWMLSAPVLQPTFSALEAVRQSGRLPAAFVEGGSTSSVSLPPPALPADMTASFMQLAMQLADIHETLKNQAEKQVVFDYYEFGKFQKNIDGIQFKSKNT